MKIRVFCLLTLVAMVLGLAPTSVLAAPASGPPAPGGLQPGVTVTYQQKIPVNIVFIGYDKKTVNQQTVLKQLPASYAPVVRYPQFYGLPGRNMGLNYTFAYNVSYASSSLTDKFFNYLKSIGTAGDPTLYQQAYNAQVSNILDVTGPVLYIDGPKAESWLAKNLGFSNNSYTLVFVNWYGRRDFKFHVYTKTDEPDPDTGYNFGQGRASRKMIAWGGSSSRLWFYDLSAGPDAWTGNYNVDDADLDGDGIPDYRMPPIWEYNKQGYRNSSQLSQDLGWVARYVAIDMLFTSSPLYDPLNTAPALGGSKVVNVAMLEDDPASLGTDWIKMDFVKKQLSAFEPYYKWQSNLTDTNPIDAGSLNAFRIWADILPADDCWNAYGTTFAELFCYYDANKATYVPAYNPADHVESLFAFNTVADNMGSQYGLLGYTDDNWVDGTQSYVFAFDTADYRSQGYGFSTTVVHESGHYFGMSHPHDGYDSEQGLDFGSLGDFYFAWAGDESNTTMSYINVANTFGRFDRDNMYRWEMAGYLNYANALLAQIQANPNASKVKNYVAAAQTDSLLATGAFKNWDYLLAATLARKTYDDLATAAGKLGIATPLRPMMIGTPSNVAPHEADPIRFPND